MTNTDFMTIPKNQFWKQQTIITGLTEIDKLKLFVALMMQESSTLTYLPKKSLKQIKK